MMDLLEGPKSILKSFKVFESVLKYVLYMLEIFIGDWVLSNLMFR